MFVVFTSTVESRTNAVYVGGAPEARHENLKPGRARTEEADNNTLGDAIEHNKDKKIFKLCNMRCSMLCYVDVSSDAMLGRSCYLISSFYSILAMACDVMSCDVMLCYRSKLAVLK